jgi:RES domain-containing protein
VTPLPGSLGDGTIPAWRIDVARYAPTWDSGEGAFRVGGRWNSPGVRAVYCSVDPATALLEVAVHKGFETLDRVEHILTAAVLTGTREVHVVSPDHVPAPEWLSPGIPHADQQAYGSDLLARHGIILLPSVVSRHSWNLIFDPGSADGSYRLERQETLWIDPRLRP